MEKWFLAHKSSFLWGTCPFLFFLTFSDPKELPVLISSLGQFFWDKLASAYCALLVAVPQEYKLIGRSQSKFTDFGPFLTLLPHGSQLYLKRFAEFSYVVTLTFREPPSPLL